VGLRIVLDAVPLLPGALDYARQGVLPGGQGRNRDFLLGEGFVRLAVGLDDARAQLLFDPQTSGGLLVALPPAAAHEFELRCAAAGELCHQVGTVVAGAGIEVV
jgi:selenide,water dikinase